MSSDLPLVTHLHTDQGILLKIPCYYDELFQSQSQSFEWLHCPSYNLTWISALAELPKHSDKTIAKVGMVAHAWDLSA